MLDTAQYFYTTRYSEVTSDASDSQWLLGKRIMTVSVTMTSGDAVVTTRGRFQDTDTSIQVSEGQTLCLHPNGAGLTVLSIQILGTGKWLIEAYEPV